MAAAPLFVASRSDLLEALRITESDDSTSAQVTSALQQVRVGFYDELTATVIETIKSIPPSDNPTTDDEIKRSRAEQAEINWVKALLLETMPAFFMSGTSSHEQVWNEEGLLRENEDDQGRLIRILMARVREALDGLKGQPDNARIRASVIGPDEPVGRPNNPHGKYFP